jgi:hypothetical protein
MQSIKSFKQFFLVALAVGLALLVCSSCGNGGGADTSVPSNETKADENSRFPEIVNLSEYPNTVFLPTLEAQLPQNKNAVYCATLLFAWDGIRKQVGKPLQINNDQQELLLLNNSTSYIDVLQPDEYNVTTTVDAEGDITVKAKFSKSLPFAVKLGDFKNKLTFDKAKVASFGMLGYDSDFSGIIKILYYQNDDNFIISLQPKEATHTIVLYKSSETFRTMSNMYADMQKKIALGNEERKNEQSQWKYIFDSCDKLVIPKIAFNIQTNYESLEGQPFMAEDAIYQILVAYQQTGFILNESGAEVESEAIIEATAAEEKEEEPVPKLMYFDKSFFITLKKAAAANPYFGLWVTNPELMIKEDDNPDK